MPAIHYGDFSIQLEEIQRTTPALRFMMGDEIYYAAVTDVKPDEPTLHFKHQSGMVYHLVPYISIESLVYEAPDQTAYINTCITTETLAPGIYEIKVKGGRGGDGGGLATYQNAPGQEAIENVCIFTVPEITPISIFRGGNGNNGLSGAKSGNATAPGGGGASGAPAAVFVNGRICESPGGFGGRGAGGFSSNTGVVLYGRGAGGGYSSNSDGESGYANSAFAVGGGGGGGPSGLGGAGFNLSPDTYALPGGAAIGLSSGPGGDARLYNTSNGNTVAADGGIAGGGAVQWSCGGSMLYSYGGGAGGGLATGNKGARGGSGGSGVTTVTTGSYVRIYRIGSI